MSKSLLISPDLIRIIYQEGNESIKSMLEMEFPVVVRPKTYSKGDYFKSITNGNDMVVLLTEPEPGKIVAINIRSGHRFRSPVYVKDAHNITQQELNEILNIKWDFTLVERSEMNGLWLK